VLGADRVAATPLTHVKECRTLKSSIRTVCAYLNGYVAWAQRSSNPALAHLHPPAARNAIDWITLVFILSYVVQLFDRYV